MKAIVLSISSQVMSVRLSGGVINPLSGFGGSQFDGPERSGSVRRIISE
jgi:hypothetical protein